MKLYRAIWILLWTSSWMYAQNYRHFSLDHGLPSKKIYKIIQDREGFIWLATDKGIVKFDGDDFVVFTVDDGLPANDIWELTETQNGKIWYGTKAPSMGFIYRDTVYNFSFENSNHSIYPIIFTDRQDVLYRDISGQKTYHWENNQWKLLNAEGGSEIFFLHPQIRYYDKNQGLVTRDGRIIPRHFDKNIEFFRQINDSLVFIILYPEPNKAAFFNLNTLQRHFIQNLPRRKNFIRTRTYVTDQEIQLTGDNFWAVIDKDYQITDSLPFTPIPDQWRAIRDRQGNFWVYTPNNGVFLYNHYYPGGKTFFRDETVLFLKQVNDYLMVSVENKGLYVYDPVENTFRLFFNKEIPVWDAWLQSPEKYIISTENYLFLRNKDQNIRLKQSRKKIFPVNDKFYLLSYKGIEVYDRTFHNLHFIPLPMQEALIYHNGQIISGGSKGLYWIKDDYSVQPIENENFRKPVLSLISDGQKIYIGTDGYGIYAYDGRHPPHSLRGPDIKIVHDMDIRNGELWAATQKGVAVFSPENGHMTYRYLLRRNEGLPSDQIIDLEWYDDKLFVASHSGVAALDSVGRPQASMQKLYWKNFSYSDKPVGNGDETKYRKNTALHVSFGVIDFSGQEHNRYFYRLWPVQKNWVELPDKHISIGHLKPGRYRFDIKAVHPSGQTLIKEREFGIRPLWWQTRWARISGLIISLLLMGWIGYMVRRFELKKRHQQLQTQNKMYELELHALRSQMNPHFIFNALNSIQYYISDENYDQSEIYLVKFSRLIRMIFDYSRLKTIPLEKEIELLKAYLDLEKMRFGDKLRVEFHIDPDLSLHEFQIPTMLLQPIVENAVNHGIFHKRTPGTLRLEFKKTGPKELTVIISDDGVGLKKAQEIKRKSLRKHLSRAGKILADRIKLLNMSGKWKIDYQIRDLTGENSPFSTQVILKIQAL